MYQINEKLTNMSSPSEEEQLRVVFNQYLNALENGRLDIFLSNNKYESAKDIERDISRFISNYATEEEKRNYMSAKSLNKKDYIRTSQRDSFKYTEEMKNLLNCNNDNWMDAFFANNIQPKEFYFLCDRYCMLYDATKEECEKLNSKVHMYREFCAKKKCKNVNKSIAAKIEKETLPQLKLLVEDLIASKKSIDFYCETKKIKKSYIKEKLKVIEKYDNEAYELYVKQIRQNEAAENKSNAVLALQMETMIKNGIEEEGYTREFDIVDYYMITKRDPKKFIKSVEETLGSSLKISEIKRLLNSSYINVSPLKLDEKTILSIKVSVPIDGEQREITKEEKQEIIKYLKDNDIPQTEYMYRVMQKRLINRLTGRNIKKKTYS